MDKKVVLLLNMGGADNLSQVEVFLKNMFNDPYILGIKNKTLRSFVAWMITKMRVKSATKNYVALGGKSPIGDLTRSLVEKLNKTYGNENLIFDYVMNYTPPFANEVFSKYRDAKEIVLFPLYPHHSSTTIVSSLDSANAAIKELGLKAAIKTVEYFYENQSYNDIIVENIKNKVSGLDSSKIDLVFSSHSLPKKIIEKGDLYEKHTNAHVEILANSLKNAGVKFNSISLAYQSRLGPVEWLGPNLSEVLPKLDSKRALIYPISFCIDNSETDFELDIEYRHVANENKFEYYEVVKAPNDSDKFAKFIISLI
ncbi:ferrochelatase [Campylobacter iguaniorum]|uniref:ferrochelatase n=1 Tax=Campylobacter iguaniorum TaxID=1244531 RepID=UPI00073A2459|nr:ferrochelatase [Campylobacter iguaniorum]ALV24334.1 ferrochelatase [Campylobacter iguaniorum]